MLQWLISVCHLYVVTPTPSKTLLPLNTISSTTLTCTRTNPSFTVEAPEPSLVLTQLAGEIQTPNGC